jgi:glycosyltransferase involved in cell wall biosynthesis
MRLAWFTPLAPVRSGISDYSMEVLPHVLGSHEVDVFVGSADELRGLQRGFHVHNAHEFVWRDHRAPYELVIYEMGNARCHEYMWPYALRYPGLVVLHDGHLHHARAWSLLRHRRERDYRAEFEYSHHHAAPDSAQIGLSGFSGPIYYYWPMIRPIVESARAVAAHSAWLADEIRATHPARPVHRIRMGVADPLSDQSIGPKAADIRTRHGIAAGTLLVCAYGGITPEKRVPQIFRAVADTVPWRPDIHVLLVGDRSAHYDPLPDAERAGVAARVTLAGFVSDAELPAYLAAADVAMCLRWPTARETSASWLRCVAAGTATVIIDLVHQADVPALDPRTWTMPAASRTMAPTDPIGVSIDILDEDHSLRLALRRLATDDDLRRRLGRAARAYWERDHTLAAMASDYEVSMTAAASTPAPEVSLPPHLRPDPLAHARALMAPFGNDPGSLDLE